jgi:hypothetical protein
MGGAGYWWRDLVPNDGIYRGISRIYRYGDMCLYGWLSVLYNSEVSMLGGGGVDDLCSNNFCYGFHLIANNNIVVIDCTLPSIKF